MAPWLPATFAALALTVAASTEGAGNWPTYLHDTARTGANQASTALSPATASRLVERWTFKAGGGVAASPTVVGGVVYVGAWDGYEYALDEATGRLKWRTFLGVTDVRGSRINGGCAPALVGVTSSATVEDGVLYVGGGDAYWYALNAATGAVRWRVYTGDNSARGGHYNWSSPLIYHGYAYIGVASLGDCPLVQGRLLQVDLRSHRVVRAFDAAPRGQVGGAIWGSPAVDPSTGTIYVSTGNAGISPATLQPYAQAMLALDARTLALKGAWQVPKRELTGTDDPDWGSTPTLFADRTGRPLLAEANKNGVVYAFDRAKIGDGPVWRRRIANTGVCAECGDGSIAPGAVGDGALYVGGGNTIVDTVPFSGSVRALDPATGAVRWAHGTPGGILAALAYANGVVVDAEGRTLEARDARTGARLFHATTGGALFGAPSVADDRIFQGSMDGVVYAFGLGHRAMSTEATCLTPPVGRAPADNPLAPFYYGVAISADNAPDVANFDGGGASYSTRALAQAGLWPGRSFTCDGATFRWPNVAPGKPDNVVAQGQTIPLGGHAAGSALAFLGAATGGPSIGTGHIRYRNGRIAPFHLALSDWTLNARDDGRPVYHNRIVAMMPYANREQKTTPTYVFSSEVPLVRGQAITSITLPRTANQGLLHLFALTLKP